MSGGQGGQLPIQFFGTIVKWQHEQRCAALLLAHPVLGSQLRPCNYSKNIWLGTFPDLTSFLGWSRNSFKHFVGFLVDLKTPKGHFEINWPLENIIMGSMDNLRSLFRENGEKSTLNYRNLYKIFWGGERSQVALHSRTERDSSSLLFAFLHRLWGHLWQI